VLDSAIEAGPMQPQSTTDVAMANPTESTNPRTSDRIVFGPFHPLVTIMTTQRGHSVDKNADVTEAMRDRSGSDTGRTQRFDVGAAEEE
jgi:hypothetical protein